MKKLFALALCALAAGAVLFTSCGGAAEKDVGMSVDLSPLFESIDRSEDADGSAAADYSVYSIRANLVNSSTAKSVSYFAAKLTSAQISGKDDVTLSFQSVAIGISVYAEMGVYNADNILCGSLWRTGAFTVGVSSSESAAFNPEYSFGVLYVNTHATVTGTGTKANPYKTIGEALAAYRKILSGGYVGSYTIYVAGDIDLSTDGSSSTGTSDSSQYALALDFSDITASYSLLISGGWQPDTTYSSITTIKKDGADYVIGVIPGSLGNITLKNIVTQSAYYSGTETLTLSGTTGIGMITLADKAVITLGSDFNLYQQTSANGTYSSPISLVTAAENGWSEGSTVVNCGTLSAATVLSDFILTGTGSENCYLTAGTEGYIVTAAYSDAAAGVTVVTPASGVSFALSAKDGAGSVADVTKLTLGTAYTLTFTVTAAGKTVTAGSLKLYAGDAAIQTAVFTTDTLLSCSLTTLTSLTAGTYTAYMEATVDGIVYTGTVPVTYTLATI